MSEKEKHPRKTKLKEAHSKEKSEDNNHVEHEAAEQDTEAKTIQTKTKAKVRRSLEEDESNGDYSRKPKTLFEKLVPVIAITLPILAGGGLLKAIDSNRQKDLMHQMVEAEKISAAKRKQLEAQMEKSRQKAESLMQFRVPESVELTAKEQKFKNDLAKELNKGVIPAPRDVFMFMERYSNRIKPEIVDAGTVFFNDTVYEIEKDDDTKSKLKVFDKLINKLTPLKAYTLESSSAAIGLAAKAAPETQDCDAQIKILTMGVTAIDAAIAKQSYWQIFNDHMQLVVELEGKKYVVASPYTHPIEEDERSKNAAYALVPLIDVYKGYAGLPTSPAQVYNEENPADPYPIYTDNLIQYNFNLGGKKLGNYATLESVYENPGSIVGIPSLHPSAASSVAPSSSTVSGAGNGEKALDKSSFDKLKEILEQSNLEKLTDDEIVKKYVKDNSLNLSSFKTLSLASIKRVNELVKKQKIDGIEFADPSRFSKEVIIEIMKTSASEIGFPIKANMEDFFKVVLQQPKRPFINFYLEEIELPYKIIAQLNQLKDQTVVFIEDVPANEELLTARIATMLLVHPQIHNREIFIKYLKARPLLFIDWSDLKEPDYRNAKKERIPKMLKTINQEAQIIAIAKKAGLDGIRVSQSKATIQKAKEAILRLDPTKADEIAKAEQVQ